MKTHDKTINKAVERIRIIIQKSDGNVAERILLYNSVLKKLPRTILVDADSRSIESIFQGITNLFPEIYTNHYTSEQRKEQSIAFTFYVDDKAFLYRGWYDGEIILEGSWADVLQTIVKMLSLLEDGLDLKEKNAVAAYLQALK